MEVVMVPPRSLKMLLIGTVKTRYVHWYLIATAEALCMSVCQKMSYCSLYRTIWQEVKVNIEYRRWCWQVSTGDLGTLWRQAADFHLRGGEPDVAAKSLEELLRINPGDRKTLAQLVVAYAQVSVIFIETQVGDIDQVLKCVHCMTVLTCPLPFI
jgi:hypothetical protein